jgi:hypothetical protein
VKTTILIFTVVCLLMLGIAFAAGYIVGERIASSVKELPI